MDNKMNYVKNNNKKYHSLENKEIAKKMCENTDVSNTPYDKELKFN